MSAKARPSPARPAESASAAPPDPASPENLPLSLAGHFAPSPGAVVPSFLPMLQGPGTNRLTQLGTRQRPVPVDPITGTATISHNQITVSIDHLSQLAAGGPRVSAFKLFDLCAVALTAQNHYRGRGELQGTVTITLDEYMEYFGLPATKPSRDRARRRLKEDLDLLFNMALAWKEERDGEIRDYKTRVITAREIRNSRISVEFSPGMAAYLTDAYLTSYPKALFRTDERLPSSYHLGKKLSLHHFMENNQRRGTAGIISVKALLKAAPDIPSVEEVRQSGRQFDQRIRAPFEKALNNLSEVLQSWEYCRGQGQPLSEEEKADFNFAAFLKAFIKFTLTGALEPARPGGDGGENGK